MYICQCDYINASIKNHFKFSCLSTDSGLKICSTFSILLDIAREIGTFWKTNKAHIWVPNIKQGFFGITRPTEADMAKYK